MSVTIDIKQGDTLLLECVVKIDGVVQDITSWVIKSTVKYSTTFVENLVVTKYDPTVGKFRISKADTTAWPARFDNPKQLLCDIEYTLPSGQIISTETFVFACYKGVS